MNKYVNGSNAYKIDDVAPYMQTAARPNLVEVPAVRPVSDARSVAKVICICMFIVAMLGAATVYTKVLLMQAQSKVETMEQELATITEDNNNKKIQLEQNIDLKKVEEIAISQYGMQRPDKNQVVYVRVVQNDYGEIINSSVN